MSRSGYYWYVRYLYLFSFLFILSIQPYAQDKSENEIYSVAIKESLKNRKATLKRFRRILIHDSTVSPRSDAILFDFFESLLFSNQVGQDNENDVKLLLDKVRADSSQIKLGVKRFKIGFRNMLIKHSELQRIFDISARDGWREFYMKYPSSLGFISVSKIIKYKNFAAVYVDYHYGSLGASGDLYILIFDHNGWRLYTSLNIYVS
ncbi:MAG: hypothetical protein RLO12_02230 [Fulvivirga sp.]